MPDHKTISLEAALKAQQALRDAAGLGPEQFPVGAFVGMISDEIESLRQKGVTDDDILRIVRTSSGIQLTVDELVAFYATPEQRHPH